ncbi:hypothetical protein CF326_g3592 [Tilletia indica]|nr:hypothetical protein CF326_g3592 [Tilletia indica]
MTSFSLFNRKSTQPTPTPIDSATESSSDTTAVTETTTAPDATSSQSQNAGWLSSISSYLGSSIASVASPNASYDDQDDVHDLILPKDEDLADIAEADEDEQEQEDQTPVPVSKEKETAPDVKDAATAQALPAYETDDKGRKLAVPKPGGPPTTDGLESNGPRQTIAGIEQPPIDPAALAQGYIDPSTFPNGSSLNSSNEPLNVIISAQSSPEVLTRKGLQSYLRSIGFDFECLNLHSGGPQYATVDANGAQAQVFLYREIKTPFDHIFGTCLESLQGGNHIRGYLQSGTNAWFLAVSSEENVLKKHKIIPDGYNIGRDDMVKRSQSEPNGITDFFFQKWQTSVTYATNLYPVNAVANHDITVDGKTAVLTVKRLPGFKFGSKQVTPDAAEAVPVPASADVVPAAPVAAPVPVPASANGVVPVEQAATVPATPATAAVVPAPSPSAEAPPPITTEDTPAVSHPVISNGDTTTNETTTTAQPSSRKSTDRARPIKRFSMGLRRRLSGQVSKADTDKLLAEVAAAESVSSSSPVAGRASLAADTPAERGELVPVEAPVVPVPEVLRPAEEGSPAPLEVPKLKRRESQLRKFLDRVQPRKPSSSGGGGAGANGNGNRNVSGASLTRDGPAS